MMHTKVQGNSQLLSNFIDDLKGRESAAYITKQANGKYWITAVSTAAMKDREGETFTTEAIDYDIMVSKETNQYPEFRVFHSKGLGIGKVQKMSRVGIFAIDEGESYDDPFSLEVCEKMLSNNADGKWRVSRGFRILEASGLCPDCGENLLIRSKHMKVGFRCPTCKAIQLGYKGALGNLSFLKARTFDITVTDTPAVPWTGVSASPVDLSQMEVMMGRKELKERLLKAGLDEEKINKRLDSLSDETLKEYDNIPDADVLKEFSEDPGDSDENTFTLDPAVLGEFTKIVKKELTEQLEGLTVEVEEEELKEVPELIALKESVDALTELVQTLVGSRKKEVDPEDTPRSGLRILRTKAAKFPPEKDEEDGMDEEDDETTMPKGKPKAPKSCAKEFEDEEVLIMNSEGKRMKSMTELVTGGE
jgi:hypothetical protein